MLLGDGASPEGENQPIVADCDPAGDAARLLRLAEWCGRFAPIVGTSHAAGDHDADTEPPGLLFDLDGCVDLLEHRYGEGDPYRNEHRFALDVEASLDRLGLTAVTAVAGTVGLAWGLARHRATTVTSREEACGDRMLDVPSSPSMSPMPPMSPSGPVRFDRVVPAEEAYAVLEGLPIESLRLDAETQAGLRHLHFERVADLLAVDRAELGLRFGPLLARRLGQALGEIAEMVVPVRAAPVFEVHREFATPVQAREGLALAVGGMLEDLCDRLRRKERGVERLRLVVERLDLDPASLELSLSRASRRTGHLWSLLSQRLEEIDPGLGVERLLLRALRVGALPHRQRSLSRSERARNRSSVFGDDHDGDPECSADESAAAELADAIIARWGEHAVRRPGPIAGHVPEAGDRLVPIRSAPERTVASARDTSCWPRGLRPTLLLRRADPIRFERTSRLGGTERTEMVGRPEHLGHVEDVEDVEETTPEDRLDTAPGLVVWWRGRPRRVVAMEGPERIAEPWWRRDDLMPGDPALPQIREYWRCRFEGDLWVWVFREVTRECRERECHKDDLNMPAVKGGEKDIGTGRETAGDEDGEKNPEARLDADRGNDRGRTFERSRGPDDAKRHGHDHGHGHDRERGHQNGDQIVHEPNCAAAPDNARAHVCVGGCDPSRAGGRGNTRGHACPSDCERSCRKAHANDRVDFRREDRWFLHGIWA